MDKYKNNKSLDDLKWKIWKKRLGFLALVLFAMMFTSCKAKIGGAKAKVEAEEKAKEEAEEKAEVEKLSK